MIVSHHVANKPINPSQNNRNNIKPVVSAISIALSVSFSGAAQAANVDITGDSGGDAAINGFGNAVVGGLQAAAGDPLVGRNRTSDLTSDSLVVGQNNVIEGGSVTTMLVAGQNMRISVDPARTNPRDTGSSGTFFGGQGHTTTTANGAQLNFSIIHGNTNTIIADDDSNLAGGIDSIIVSGYNNTVSNSFSSFFIGDLSEVADSNNSVISGYQQTLTGIVQSSVSGQNNTINGATDSLVAGSSHTITNVTGSTVLGSTNEVTADNAFALGTNQTVAGAGSFAVGDGVQVTAGGERSVAIGSNTNVSAPDATALGLNSTVSATNGTAIAGGNVSGENGIAIGAGASAESLNATAIGPNSTVSAPSGTAIAGGNVTAEGGIAIGAGSVSDLDAAGAAANTPAAQAFTIDVIDQDGNLTGQTVEVNITETFDAVGQVDFGNRVLSGVADGRIAPDSSDAINGSQLYQILQEIHAVAGADGEPGQDGQPGKDGEPGERGPKGEDGEDGSNCRVGGTDCATAITQNRERIVDNSVRISVNAAAIEQNKADIAANRQAISELRDESRQGIAGVAALGAAEVDHLLAGESGVGGGIGNFKGQNAFAFVFENRPTRAFQWNVGVGGTDDEIVSRVGAAYKFGSPNGR